MGMATSSEPSRASSGRRRLGDGVAPAARRRPGRSLAAATRRRVVACALDEREARTGPSVRSPPTHERASGWFIGERSSERAGELSVALCQREGWECAKFSHSKSSYSHSQQKSCRAVSQKNITTRSQLLAVGSRRWFAVASWSSAQTACQGLEHRMWLLLSHQPPSALRAHLSSQFPTSLRSLSSCILLSP